MNPNVSSYKSFEAYMTLLKRKRLLIMKIRFHLKNEYCKKLDFCLLDESCLPPTVALN